MVETFSTDDDVSVWVPISLLLAGFRRTPELSVVIHTTAALSLTSRAISLSAVVEKGHTFSVANFTKFSVRSRQDDVKRCNLSRKALCATHCHQIHHRTAQTVWIATYLAGTLGRGHLGGRGQPRRSTARVHSEVAAPRNEQHTFEQNTPNCCSSFWVNCHTGNFPSFSHS